MPRRDGQPTSLTRDQVAAFRLTRHHLAQRASRTEWLAVVRNMGGAQAQLLSAAQLSLATRIHELEAVDIEAALEERTLVKASCMRHTLFLIPAEDLAYFALTPARRARKEINWARRKGVSDRDINAAIDATLVALEHPLTRPEIAEQVSRSLGMLRQDVHGGGWGSRSKVAAVPIGHLVFPVVDLVHLAGARGVICYGPQRGAEPTFVRADCWLPHWQDLPVAEAEARLLHVYLRAFGPATAADFARWSGFSLTEARAVYAREQASLATVLVEGQPMAVLNEDEPELAQMRIERPHVRLLPYFDSFILGHQERDHLVEAEHRAKIYRPQGWVAPVVLVDGRAVAVWEHTVKRRNLQLRVIPFAPLSQGIIARLHEEAAHLARFVGAPAVDVQLS